MISRETALKITVDGFPKGPEELAKKLSVHIIASPLVGAEGWCIRGPVTVIRLNSTSSKTRQRFTLAHELAHLVLGTKPDIASEPFRSDGIEERDADQLASEFLIPDERLKSFLGGNLPVDAKTLTRIAKAANVSPVMVACRVVNSTEMLGLKNAAVVFFVDSNEQWRYSHQLLFDEAEAHLLLKKAQQRAPDLVRHDNRDGNIVVGSIIDAQSYQVLLIQLLEPDEAAQLTYEEKLRDLARKLFGADVSFRQSIAGSLGIVKQKCAGQTLDQAVDYFACHYPGTKYTGAKASKLNSEVGRQYIRLYLQRWFGQG